ncbi:hypothetical protein RCH12_000669 [Cryobacterium sp. MP_3.1]|uniref:Uncharacterized protein n=1 Tax=Cryobacterium zongtaii TaxID=1259217 RepID=A0A2S3Z4Z6_9MICO|nr:MULTISPECIES: hypothetical protein [Cryobacterium]MEC5183222.1 hypothetical protein [Cryobacterium sp. MP_3.1]POH58716.1 hypothetical protein C3B59_18735 [Cryobacterium zongtaii]
MNDANEANTHQEPAGAAGEPAVVDAPVSGAPEKRRSALRPWLWLPVAGFAVLSVTGAVVGGFLVGGSVVDGVNAGRAGVLAVPTEVATDVAEPTPTSSAESTEIAAGALIPLDEHVDVGSTFPIWGYPMQTGWEILTFDQAGINQSENVELGCLFTSSQNKQPAYDLDATDDLSDTVATMATFEQQQLDAGNQATLVGDRSSTDFGINLPGADERIEFLTTRIDYLEPEMGVSYTNEIAVRAMPLAESAMYIVVTCPTALVDAGQSPFEELRAGLAVIVEPAS